MSDVEIRVGVDGHYDWVRIVDDLNRLLRLRTTPIGMKRFATVAEMETIPKVRRPGAIHTTDQIVGQASRNGWTVGITKADLVGDQCAAVVGLHPRDDKWLTGAQYSGVWYSTPEDAAAHQAAMDLPAFGQHEALAVSPLAGGRLDPPDICLIYATPAQMILFINGLQWTGYKKLEWGCVGESSCADSWGRALATGEPSLSIPCFAERRYGGVMEDELLMAIPPKFLPKVIEGLEALSRNGLRYPIAQYGVNADARAGLGVSYGRWSSGTAQGAGTMLIKNVVLERIASGEIDTLFRRQKRPTVKTGGTLRTAIGMLDIMSVDQIDLDEVTADDAKRAGFASVDAAVASLTEKPDGVFLRVRVRPGGPDPRIALREGATLDEADLNELRRRLDRLDANSRRGPWTRQVLAMIAEHPHVRAPDLAESIGWETAPFKSNVSKLKALGLTISHSPGYELSPRGRAAIAALDDVVHGTEAPT